MDVWTRNALPYAPSHRSVTLQTLCDEPRSTCHHCASANVLDQRVPRLPSTAALAGVPPFSVVDAVAVLPCATLAVPQVPAVGVGVGVGVIPPTSPKTWNSHSE